MSIFWTHAGNFEQQFCLGNGRQVSLENQQQNFKTPKHWDFSRFEEEYLRATKEAEKIEAVLGGLTKKNQAQVGLKLL